MHLPPDYSAPRPFGDVDAADRLTPLLVDYLLQAEQHRDIARLHTLAASHAPVPPGGTVLDAGCGVGGVALGLAKAVGPLGTVIGIDTSDAVLEVARSRPGGPVRFEKADVTDLPFPDDEFDLVRCERVLQHVSEADRAVREMVRVCRPGGHVLLLDTDWASLSCDLDDEELTAAVLGNLWRSAVHPRSGLRLRKRLVEAGAAGVRATPYVFTMTTAEEAGRLVPTFRRDLPADVPLVPADRHEAWFAALDEAERAGTLLVTFTAWVVAGHKPTGVELARR